MNAIKLFLLSFKKNIFSYILVILDTYRYDLYSDDDRDRRCDSEGFVYKP